jgi:DNA-binding MarR family transcriptional regulator
MVERASPPRPNVETRIDPAIVAWLRLARVYQKIDRRTDEMMKTYGLSVSRFDVLNHAGTPEGRTQQELAETLLVTKGNVTQLIDAMERDGLLERRRDGRTKRIYLTDAGRALRSQVVAVQEVAIAAEFSALAPDDLDALARILRVLDRSMHGPP